MVRRRTSITLKPFTESQLFVKFVSNCGVSIRVGLDTLNSRERANKANLKLKKEKLKEQYDKIDQYFTEQEPYYADMLHMVNLKKKAQEEKAQRAREDKISQLMKDPNE